MLQTYYKHKLSQTLLALHFIIILDCTKEKLKPNYAFGNLTIMSQLLFLNVVNYTKLLKMEEQFQKWQAYIPLIIGVH